MAKIHGAYTAMITPMLNDGSVDYDGFKKNVLFQLEQGIDGLLPLGTSGETPTLSEDEEDKLLDIAIPLVREFNAKNGKDVKVLVGAGSNNTRD
ncbi:MAG TPA: 4-hydroxy-tetrahydrodipicolinate synthase, partial [Treponema sp.]|nr:4-hydroxy-tetrahydrodipicolinate synthase [Treponema sp.]